MNNIPLLLTSVVSVVKMVAIELQGMESRMPERSFQERRDLYPPR